jgi:TolB-like protein
MVKGLRACLILCGLLAVCVQGISPVQAQSGGSDFTLGLLGDELLEGLKVSGVLNGKTRVAVWPFQSRDIPVSTRIAEKFNTDLLANLQRQAKGKLTFVGRKELRALIADLEETNQDLENPVATVSKSARVDILIVGHITLENRRIALSYKALGASNGKTRVGDIVASTSSQLLALEQNQASVTLEQGMRQGARKLTQLASDAHEILLDGIRFENTRMQTRFGRYIEEQMRDELASAYTNKITGRQVRINRAAWQGQDKKADKSRSNGKLNVYTLTGSYWDFGKSVDVKIRLRAPDGRTVSWSGRVLPPQNMNVRPNGNFPPQLLENDGLGPFRFALRSNRGETPVYNIGEKLNLEIRLDQDAWMYCFYRQADGRMLKIIPNRYHEDAKFKGGKLLTIPGSVLPFDLVFEEPAGTELVKCFAASKDVTSRLPKSIRSNNFPVLPDGMDFRLPQIFRQMKGIGLSEASIVINVLPVKK